MVNGEVELYGVPVPHRDVTSGKPAARRTAACLLAVLLTAACAVSMALSTVASTANPAGPHDPFGHVDKVVTTSGGVLVAGWAADPDGLSSTETVLGLVDGTSAAKTTTKLARPDVVKAKHTGPKTGFSFTVPVPSGSHTLCIAARTLGAGFDTVLLCRPLPLGTVLSSSQVATHNPIGRLDTATVSSTSVRITGWAADLDYRVRPTTVVAYVDGMSGATITTSIARPDVVKAKNTGPSPGFAATIALKSGTHLVCIWIVNIGIGDNVAASCRAVDTRGPAGTATPVPVPKVNSAVVIEATKHLGQRYGWGAAGPSTFDCSGLVIYSYRVAGKTGLPRVAADQFSAARLIPAARAVKGDLVFYHDNVGYVYHVGIYTGPGASIAAIDESHGVARQSIWAPSATYGSFTHT
jgi:cell wall-associated NlpC family hydrolase